MERWAHSGRKWQAADRHTKGGGNTGAPSDESKLSQYTTEQPPLDSQVPTDDFLAQGGGMGASRQAEGMDVEASNPQANKNCDLDRKLAGVGKRWNPRITR